MSPPHTRRQVLAVSSVVGVSLLAGCQALSSPSNESTPDETSNSLGLAYSKSSSSYPSDEEIHSGWVHIVSDGDSADLTFDLRFCSALGDVEPELTHSVADEYVLRFTVSGEFSSETPSGAETKAECRSVTRLVGGANVPSDWKTLSVEVNNIGIQIIERSGTMPELRPLPDPVRSR